MEDKPMKRDELYAVIANLDRIDSLGETENLCNEITRKLRGRPANPRDAMTMGEQLYADRLAMEAARLLQIPFKETRSVAMELFGATSWEQAVAQVIRNYAAQFDRDMRPPRSQLSQSSKPSRPVTVNVRRSRKGGRYGR
jgi:hypothetical protein